MTTSLDDHLTKLEDTGLIQLARLEPDLEYLFRHALVQDATYESLLKQDRRALHRTVGEALERLYPDRLETLAAALAHHYDVAEDPARALHYLTLAADHAFAQYANEEAIAFYTRARAIARDAGDLPSESRIHLYRNLGRAHELRGEYEPALTIYEAMESEGERRAESAMTLAALTARATIYATPTPVQKPRLAIALAEQAIALAQTLGDRATEARALWTIGLAHMYGTGRAPDAIRTMEESLVIARELDLQEQIAFTLTDLGNVLTIMGSASEAVEGLAEAREIWRSLGNKPMLCFCLSLSAEMGMITGDLEFALVLVRESIEIGTAIGNQEALAYAYGMMGAIIAMRGEVGPAIKLLYQGIEAANAVGSLILAVIPSYILATIYGTIGACDRALEIRQSMNELGFPRSMPAVFQAQMLMEMGGADRACQDPRAYLAEVADVVQMDVEQNSGVDIEQWAGLSLAEAHLTLNEPEQALPHVDNFLALASKNEWHVRAAEALELRARVLHALGRDEEEGENLAESRRIVDERGIVALQWRVYASVANREERLGRAQEAAVLRREGRTIVDRIASSLDDPHLKRGFLALPEVRGLIRGGSSA